MANPGRPVKLNKDIESKIILALKTGAYIETAAAYAGISKATFYEWLRRGEREKQRVNKNTRNKTRKRELPFVELSDAIKKALADAEIRDIMKIEQASKTQWQAAAWRLERRFPDRWGRKDNYNMRHSGDIAIQIVDDISDTSGEEREPDEYDEYDED